MTNQPSPRKTQKSRPVTPWAPSMSPLHGTTDDAGEVGSDAAPADLSSLLGRSRPLTIAEVAGELGVSTSSVYNLIHDDGLVAIELSSKWRVRLGDLIDFIESRSAVGGIR